MVFYSESEEGQWDAMTGAMNIAPKSDIILPKRTWLLTFKREENVFQIIMEPLAVTRAQVIAFLKSIAQTLIDMDDDDILDAYLTNSDRAVIISFSGDYEPFIGFTPGWNPFDQRAQIKQGCYILGEIADALERQGREIPGGRIFIDKDCVYLKNEHMQHIAILLLDWQGLDPYELITAVRDMVLYFKQNGSWPPPGA